jgi:hypothetical protein
LYIVRVLQVILYENDKNYPIIFTGISLGYIISSMDEIIVEPATLVANEFGDMLNAEMGGEVPAGIVLKPFPEFYRQERGKTHLFNEISSYIYGFPVENDAHASGVCPLWLVSGTQVVCSSEYPLNTVSLAAAHSGSLFFIPSVKICTSGITLSGLEDAYIIGVPWLHEPDFTLVYPDSQTLLNRLFKESVEEIIGNKVNARNLFDMIKALDTEPETIRKAQMLAVVKYIKLREQNSPKSEHP